MDAPGAKHTRLPMCMLIWACTKLHSSSSRVSTVPSSTSISSRAPKRVFPVAISTSPASSYCAEPSQRSAFACSSTAAGMPKPQMLIAYSLTLALGPCVLTPEGASEGVSPEGAAARTAITSTLVVAPRTMASAAAEALSSPRSYAHVLPEPAGIMPMGTRSAPARRSSPLAISCAVPSPPMPTNASSSGVVRASSPACPAYCVSRTVTSTPARSKMGSTLSNVAFPMPPPPNGLTTTWMRRGARTAAVVMAAAAASTLLLDCCWIEAATMSVSSSTARLRARFEPSATAARRRMTSAPSAMRARRLSSRRSSACVRSRSSTTTLPFSSSADAGPRGRALGKRSTRSRSPASYQDAVLDAASASAAACTGDFAPRRRMPRVMRATSVSVRTSKAPRHASFRLTPDISRSNRPAQEGSRFITGTHRAGA